MKRGTAAFAMLLTTAVAFGLAWPEPVAGAAGVSYYLKGDSEPIDSLSNTVPAAAALPNFDPDRDEAPGLVLIKGGQGILETDPSKYQQWRATASGLRVEGPVTLDLWAAPKDFDGTKTVNLTAYLLDCDSTCTDLASSTEQVSSSTWEKITFAFPSVEHVFNVGRSIGVTVVVDASSKSDAWLAYDTTSYPSHLFVPQLVEVTDAYQAVTSSGTGSSTMLPAQVSDRVEREAVVTIGKSGGEAIDDALPRAYPVKGGKRSLVVVASTASLIGAGVAEPRSLSPLEGLQVSLLSAAYVIRSQLLASVALGTLGTVLLVIAARRRVGDQ